MTQYEQTLTTGLTRPHASTRQGEHDEKAMGAFASRAFTYVVAAVLMLLVLFGAVEMTMGYGLSDSLHSPQPDQGPVL